MFDMTVKYLLSLLYVFSNVFVIKGAIIAFRDEQYGWFGWHISLAVVHLLMAAYLIFVETF